MRKGKPAPSYTATPMCNEGPAGRGHTAKETLLSPNPQLPTTNFAHQATPNAVLPQGMGGGGSRRKRII